MEIKNDRFNLFIDLDGVLADFDGGYSRVFGAPPSKKGKVDWKGIKDYGNFFLHLNPMPDYHRLVDFVSAYNPTILTGLPSSIEEAEENKRAWVAKYIGKDVPVICCKSKDKSLHMKRAGDVLIDDWEKYRHLWEMRGGEWITHINAEQSIEKLKEYIAWWDQMDNEFDDPSHIKLVGSTVKR